MLLSTWSKVCTDTYACSTTARYEVLRDCIITGFDETLATAS